MNRKLLVGLLIGLGAAGTAGLIAQTSTGIAGPIATGGGARPAGATFATQYRAGTSQFGGTGPGTSGHVLTSNGAGAAPTFQANAAGDVSSNTSTSVDNEMVLFSSTSGKLIKRATGTGAVSVASGVVTAGTLSVANGGTNLTASADDNVMVGNGTTWETKAVGSCSGATNALTYNTTTNAFGCNTIGGGSATTGSFTLTWTDACTTSPTTVIDWTLDPSGTVVTWKVNPLSVTSCTSDSTSFNTGTAQVPVGLRPTTTSNTLAFGVRTQDNGTVDSGVGCLNITSAGVVIVNRAAASGCQGGNWTGSGSKSMNGTADMATTVTYYLN